MQTTTGNDIPEHWKGDIRAWEEYKDKEKHDRTSDEDPTTLGVSSIGDLLKEVEVSIKRLNSRVQELQACIGPILRNIPPIDGLSSSKVPSEISTSKSITASQLFSFVQQLSNLDAALATLCEECDL